MSESAYSYTDLYSALSAQVAIERLGPGEIAVRLLDMPGRYVDTQTFPVNTDGTMEPRHYNGAIGLIRGYKAAVEYNSAILARLGVVRVDTPAGVLLGYKTGDEGVWAGIAVDLVKPDGSSGRVALVEFSSGEEVGFYEQPLHTFAYDGVMQGPASITGCDVSGPRMSEVIDLGRC